jgi:hypothetical protein
MAFTDFQRISSIQQVRMKHNRQQRQINKKKPVSTAVKVTVKRTKEEWAKLIEKAKSNFRGE